MSGYDVFDLIAGLIGILGVLYGVLERLLPATRILSFEQTLARVDGCLQATIEEGSIEDISAWRERLVLLKDRHRELAYRSHRAATFCQQCLEMLEGLSCSIISAHHESRAILAEIATWKLQSTQSISPSVDSRLGETLVASPEGAIALLPCPREAAILLTTMPAALPVSQASGVHSLPSHNVLLALIERGMTSLAQLRRESTAAPGPQLSNTQETLPSTTATIRAGLTQAFGSIRHATICSGHPCL